MVSFRKKYTEHIQAAIFQIAKKRMIIKRTFDMITYSRLKKRKQIKPLKCLISGCLSH